MFYTVKAETDYESDNLLWIKKPNTLQIPCVSMCNFCECSPPTSVGWIEAYIHRAEIPSLQKCRNVLVSLLQCYSLSFGSQRWFCAVPYPVPYCHGMWWIKEFLNFKRGDVVTYSWNRRCSWINIRHHWPAALPGSPCSNPQPETTRRCGTRSHSCWKQWENSHLLL